MQVLGAPFCLGDPHCAQGDGEVCGTTTESQRAATGKLYLVKSGNLRFPHFVTPGTSTTVAYEATTDCVRRTRICRAMSQAVSTKEVMTVLWMRRSVR